MRNTMYYTGVNETLQKAEETYVENELESECKPFNT